MFKNRSFSLLLTGQSLADIGDILYIVSVISIIYRLTNSAIATSFVPFIITTCMLISSLLTPLITAKISLNQLLTISQGVKTAVILGLALYVQWVGDQPMIVLVFLLIAMVAFLDGCANPIRQSLLPHYVEERDLLRANSIAETVIQSIQVGSWFVGSSLLLLFTPSRLIWGVVVLFFHRNLAFKASTRCGTYGTSTNKEMVVNYGRVAIHPSNACTKSSCTYGFTGIDGRSSVGRSDFTCLCRRSIAGFFSMVGLSQRHFFLLA